MAATFLKPVLIISAFSALLACAPKPAISTQDQFITNLKTHCGKAYAGKLVSTDEVDADMINESMTMYVDCSGGALRIPFAVGTNRSRTWVFTKTETGLRLKHQHNHKDGSEDKVSQYGGDTADMGTATRQDFPVDEFSKALFLKTGLDVSVTNIWAVEITPETYAYEMRRENRLFRVEFDLSKEIPTPPKPW